jgi:hypothetical protein
MKPQTFSDPDNDSFEDAEETFDPENLLDFDDTVTILNVGITNPYAVIEPFRKESGYRFSEWN